MGCRCVYVCVAVSVCMGCRCVYGDICSKLDFLLVPPFIYE